MCDIIISGEEEDSSVTMELDDDMITAAIETKDDTYHLEV
jgi:tRNA threonylcarbamoyladenosine modification (KEOPS) complex  Pcc1 subunit